MPRFTRSCSSLILRMFLYNDTSEAVTESCGSATGSLAFTGMGGFGRARGKPKLVIPSVERGTRVGGVPTNGSWNPARPGPSLDARDDTTLSLPVVDRPVVVVVVEFDLAVRVVDQLLLVGSDEAAQEGYPSPAPRLQVLAEPIDDFRDVQD